MINDNIIKKAALRAHEAFLHAASATIEHKHTFSKEFKDKMRSLLPETSQTNNTDNKNSFFQKDPP